MPYGNGLRAPPCTRKGHCPLTRMSAKLTFCLLWVQVPPSGEIAWRQWRKPFGLLLWGTRAPSAMPCGNGLRAPPCTRKGHCPLTRMSAKLTFCLLWVQVPPSGGIAWRQWRKPSGLLLWGTRAPSAMPCGNDLRAPPCTCKGHCPLTYIGEILWKTRKELCRKAMKGAERKSPGRSAGRQKRCQNSIFSSIYRIASGTESRICSIVSRSRTVTVPSSRVWKSTVRQYGVPISSWRR